MSSAALFRTCGRTRWLRATAIVAMAGMAAALMTASVQAANGGAWSAQAKAPTLRQRDWRYDSDALHPPAKATALEQARVTRVYWRYAYTPPDPALQVWLCAASRCIEAPTARGMSDAFAGMAANTAFTFSFKVAGRGMLPRPLKGTGLQVIVNYRR